MRPALIGLLVSTVVHAGVAATALSVNRAGTPDSEPRQLHVPLSLFKTPVPAASVDVPDQTPAAAPDHAGVPTSTGAEDGNPPSTSRNAANREQPRDPPDAARSFTADRGSKSANTGLAPPPVPAVPEDSAAAAFEPRVGSANPAVAADRSADRETVRATKPPAPAAPPPATVARAANSAEETADSDVAMAAVETRAENIEPPANPTDSAASLAYVEQVRRAIEGRKFYPRSARLKRVEGRVLVTFVIAGDGSVSDIRAVGRSPAADLARAAESAVRAVGSFDPIPPEIGRDRWKFEIPVVFSLD